MDVIFDIDGTLADSRHREHHIQKDPPDWQAWNRNAAADKPIAPIVEVLNGLHYVDWSTHILLVTARREFERDNTVLWLNRYGIPYDRLYMRPDDDHRPSEQVKSDLLDKLRTEGYDPQLVFEDRASNVAMWRRRGLVCCQVDEGNF